jgi:hypothetical protein
MKKLITVLLALALVGLLFGCTKEDSADTNTPDADPTIELPTDAVPAEIDTELETVIDEEEELDVGEII